MCVQGFFGSEAWGNRSRVGPSRKWEDNIKVDLKEVGSEGVEWADLAQDKENWRLRSEYGTEILGLLTRWGTVGS